MIVCSCHAVTEREIRRAAQCGAQTACEVAEMCGAGSACGGCRETVHALLEDAHGERHTQVSRADLSAGESVSA